jgi:hypothetical protein
LPELVPELVPEPVQALLQGLSLLLPGPVPGRALEALPGRVPVLPSSPLLQASAPQPSCIQRLQRILLQRKVLKTELLRFSSFRYHLLSNYLSTSLYLFNHFTSRVPGRVPGLELVPVQALLQGLSLLLPGPEPGRVLPVLLERVPGLPSSRLPQVSAPQPSCIQRLQRTMPQRKPLK